MPPSFRHVKVGDIVNRRMGTGGPIMSLKVTEITDDLILCGPAEEGWAFDRDTGAEEDPELGWGVAFGKTGTYLEP